MNWTQSRKTDTPRAAHALSGLIDKDRVAIDIHFGRREFSAYRYLALYVGDIIDVGIEILPMKELQQQMSSGVAYYEGELYNLIREGRGVPAVPLVLIGVAP